MNLTASFRYLLLLALLSLASATLAATLNVPSTSYKTIQSAITASHNGDLVLVAAGTYKERINFNGKLITVKSTNPASATVVAATIINGNAAGSVVTFNHQETNAAVLQGFTITNGTGTNMNFGGLLYPMGGGIFCSSASQTISNNNIQGNNVAKLGDGGGVAVLGGSPLIVSNTITGNHASGDGSGPGGGGGGGVFVYNGSPTITSNTISGNQATATDQGSGGGGIDTFDESATSGTPVISGNLISGNTATCVTGAAGGGGIHVESPATITGNVITGNTTNGEGGGLDCVNGSHATISNNTISGNSAITNGGGGICSYNSAITISNTIIASSSRGGGIRKDGGTAPVIKYCDVYSNTGGNYVGGAAAGTGCLSVDALFADAAHGNYRLKSCNGRWNGSAWVLDATTSPCLDAGNPASAFSLEPSPNGGCVNLGYDGNTSHASKSSMVASHSPASGATAVARATKVSITFRSAVQHASAQSHFSLKNPSAVVVGGGFVWSGNTMTFTPTSTLAANTKYTVALASGILKNPSGTIGWGESFTFTTGTSSAARVAVAATAVPTSAGAQITVSLTAAADVTVTIRNLAGREIALLQPGQLAAGVQSLVWNGQSAQGTKAPAGTYLVAVSARGADGASASSVTSLRR